MPMMASAKPMNSEVRPRSAESPKAEETVTKASTISAKYSRGPKTSASLTMKGAMKASAERRDQAGDEGADGGRRQRRTAAPARAILLPSSAVTIEALSPGVFSRIEVVEPPYMPP